MQNGIEGQSENIQFGIYLRKAMAFRKLTQTQLAAEAEVSQGAISRYLNGKAIPQSAELLRISRALGVNINYLLTGEGEFLDHSAVWLKMASSIALTEVSDDPEGRGKAITSALLKEIHRLFHEDCSVLGTPEQRSELLREYQSADPDIRRAMIGVDKNLVDRHPDLLEQMEEVLRVGVSGAVAGSVPDPDSKSDA